MKILHPHYGETKVRLRDDQFTHQPHSTRHITISATAAARSSVDGVVSIQSEFRQYLQIILPWTAADGVFTILGGKSSRRVRRTASV